MTSYPPDPNPYRGVSWHKRQKRWRVKLKQRVYGRPPLEFYMEFPGKPEFEEVAARAYDAVARMVFGKCCTLNFPDKGLPGSVSLLEIRRKLLRAGWTSLVLKGITTPL